MVGIEAAIKRYMEVIGKMPLGVALGSGAAVAIPPNVMTAEIPALAPGTVAVMPLQSLLDLVTGTIYIMEDEEEEDDE